MATHDPRIERLKKDVLAEERLPTECSALLNPSNTLTEIRLGEWAKELFVETSLFIDSSAPPDACGDDLYDKENIRNGLSKLSARPEKQKY